MKKKNPFERFKQYYYSDNDFDEKGEVTSRGDINWWIDEDDLEDFKEQWEEQLTSGDIKLIEEREINGKEYNEWIIGNYFGDFEGKYMDEECPECQCLLVDPECREHDDSNHEFKRVQPTGKERFCSNHECEYVSEEFDAYLKSDEEFWTWLGKQPELPKFREDGQTFEEFCEKYGFEAKPTMECITCKNIVPYSDFYRNKMGAHISYSHDECTNKGPSIYRPLGKEAEKWASLLG